MLWSMRSVCAVRNCMYVCTCTYHQGARLAYFFSLFLFLPFVYGSEWMDERNNERMNEHGFFPLCSFDTSGV